MSVLVREINYENREDVHSLIQMLHDFQQGIRKTAPLPVDAAVVESLRQLGHAKVYLCEVDGNRAGMAICFRGFSTFHNKELLNVHDLYVRPQYQGKGLGGKMLDFIEQDCRAMGFCRVTLEVSGDNAGALGLYRKKGYFGNDVGDPYGQSFAMKKELV